MINRGESTSGGRWLRSWLGWLELRHGALQPGDPISMAGGLRDEHSMPRDLGPIPADVNYPWPHGELSMT